MKRSGFLFDREWIFLLSLAGLCLILFGGIRFLYTPGLQKIRSLQSDIDDLSANVYRKSWLDSTQEVLQDQVNEETRRLTQARSRILPDKPMQQIVDTLRKSALQSGIEILETQVASTQQDSLNTSLLRLHARGTYPELWHYLKTMEARHPWWSIREMLVKPAGGTAQHLDILMHLSAYRLRSSPT